MTWKRFFKTLTKDIKVLTTTLDKYGQPIETEMGYIEGYLQKETVVLQNEKGEVERAEYILWADQEIGKQQLIEVNGEKYKILESKVISIYSPFLGDETVYKYFLRRIM